MKKRSSKPPTARNSATGIHIAAPTTQSTSASARWARTSWPTARCQAVVPRKRASGVSHAATWWRTRGKSRPTHASVPCSSTIRGASTARGCVRAAATMSATKVGSRSRSLLSTSIASPVAAAAPEFTLAPKPPLVVAADDLDARRGPGRARARRRRRRRPARGGSARAAARRSARVGAGSPWCGTTTLTASTVAVGHVADPRGVADPSTCDGGRLDGPGDRLAARCLGQAGEDVRRRGGPSAAASLARPDPACRGSDGPAPGSRGASVAAACVPGCRSSKATVDAPEVKARAARVAVSGAGARCSTSRSGSMTISTPDLREPQAELGVLAVAHRRVEAADRLVGRAAARSCTPPSAASARRPGGRRPARSRRSLAGRPYAAAYAVSAKTSRVIETTPSGGDAGRARRGGARGGRRGSRARG